MSKSNFTNARFPSIRSLSKKYAKTSGKGDVKIIETPCHPGSGGKRIYITDGKNSMNVIDCLRCSMIQHYLYNGNDSETYRTETLCMSVPSAGSSLESPMRSTVDSPMGSTVDSPMGSTKSGSVSSVGSSVESPVSSVGSEELPTFAD